MKRLALVTAVMMAAMMVPAGASADGSKTGPYGEVVKKPKVEQPREKVTHAPVDAGLEDVNWVLVAVMMGVGGVVVLGMSRMSEYAYWLD